MKAARRGLARRYARALRDVAVQQNLDGNTLRAELDAWSAMVQDHPEAREALTSPVVTAEQRQRTVRALAERVRSSPLLVRLLDLLALRGRLELLPALAQEYAVQWNASRGVTAAEVLTAVPLDQGEREAIARALAARTGGEVELTTSVEPALVGGVVVRMAGRTYDGSVRTRLAALRARLAGA